MKKLASWSINITAWSIFSASLVLAGVKLSDRLDEKYPPKPKPEQYPAVMARIDSLQGLTPLMKETALNRLSKLSTDSVEKIIKAAGYQYEITTMPNRRKNNGNKHKTPGTGGTEPENFRGQEK